jgi:hypothetical protein
MMTVLLVIGGVIYVLGAGFTFLVMHACFPLSKLSELVLPSLGWPVILPLLWIGLSG